MLLAQKMEIESKRWQRTDIQDNIEEMPGHYFNNRGGVLIKKQFGGFMKYHPNDQTQLEW